MNPLVVFAIAIIAYVAVVAVAGYAIFLWAEKKYGEDAALILYCLVTGILTLGLIPLCIAIAQWLKNQERKIIHV